MDASAAAKSLPMTVLLLGLCFLQFGLVSIAFPLSELYTAKPLLRIDAPFHWYQMKLGANLGQTGNLVGYDPFFGAGYLGGVTYNISAKLPTLVAGLLRNRANEMIIYKIYCFIAAILAPVVFSLSLQQFRLNLGEVFVGSAFALMLWWTSVLRWYHTAGMVSFVLSSYLAMLYLALMFLCWKGCGSWTRVVILSLLGVTGMILHPFFPLGIVVAALIYGALNWKTLPKRETLLVVFGVPLVILCFNLFWLLPIYRNLSVLTHEISSAPYQKIVDVSLLWREFLGVWSGDAHGSKLYAPLVIASLWGCCFAELWEKRKLAIIFGVSGAALIVFAAVGAIVPVFGTFQPNRFAPVGYLFLIVPAAIGFSSMVQSAVLNGRGKLKFAALTCLGLTCPPALYAANEVRREVSYADIGHFGARPPEVRGIGEYSSWVLSWLQHRTTGDCRILFETSKGRIHDGGHMAGYYAYLGQREFIGGPYPFMNFAGFWDGWLFNRPIEEISHNEFLKYMELYNIGWVIVHSDESKRYLKNIAGIVAQERFKELQTYKIERVCNYFLSGRGTVLERRHNNLVLGELSGDRVILKYHYVPGLVSQPSVQIAPIEIGGDPEPFIMIVHPPKELRLYLP